MSHTEFVRVSTWLFCRFTGKTFFQFFCIFCYKSLNRNSIEGFGKYRGILTGTHGINGF
ncbi:hypothetical protein T4D_967 [Trichinella pseudospiralis]|uniref:Uncharacterized protein n=1 Tax=Trichinella pseudospiralis TaxID=6337 RepID=A0A0V1F1I4_TRIPS|nr:hypothetical protein T4D_967 [Trichinella pseudospiralis]